MDWAVWEQTHDQVSRILFPNFAQENNYMGCERQCDCYFGYGFDVIEENSLNEKSCIEVLRILISKANAEILELEEDLITLQSQLAWADESWSETCSSALNEKIDCLDISMRSLEANVECEQDFAEKIHDIVKPLLENYFHQEDEQNERPVNRAVPKEHLSLETAKKDIAEKGMHECTIVRDSSSDASGKATDDFRENKDLSGFDLVTNGKDGLKRHCSASKERSHVLNSILKTAGKGRKFPRTVKPSSASSSDASKHSNNSQGKNKLSRIDWCTKIKEHNSTDLIIVLKSSLQCDGRVSSIPETSEDEQPVNRVVRKEDLSLETEKKDVAEKGKHQCTITKDFSSDALRRATDNSSEKKDLSNFDLILARKDALKKHNSASKVRSLALNPTLKTAGKGRILPRTIEPSGASGSDTSKHANGRKEKNKLSRIDPKVNGRMEAKEHISTARRLVLKSSFQQEGESNFSETAEPADHIVQFGFSNLHDVTEESDVSPKHIEGPDTAPIDKIDPSLSSLKIEKKRRKTPRRMKGPDVGLTEKKAADSLLQLLNHKREHLTKQHPTEEPNGKAKLAVNGGESNSNLPLKPQKQRAKREHQQKKKTKSDLDTAKEQGVALDVNVDSASISEKKRKRQNSPCLEETKKLKSLQISLVKLCADTTESTIAEDLCITRCLLTGDPSNNETSKLLISPTIPCSEPWVLDLERLTLVDLKAVAKQHNMRGYSKLTKAKLVEELGLKLMV